MSHELKVTPHSLVWVLLTQNKEEAACGPLGAEKLQPRSSSCGFRPAGSHLQATPSPQWTVHKCRQSPAKESSHIKPIHRYYIHHYHCAARAGTGQLAYHSQAFLVLPGPHINFLEPDSSTTDSAEHLHWYFAGLHMGSLQSPNLACAISPTKKPLLCL